MKKKYLITIVVITLVALSAVGYSYLNKIDYPSLFDQQEQNLINLIEERNRGKDFTRYELFEGPNTVDLPISDFDPNEDLEIINNL